MGKAGVRLGAHTGQLLKCILFCVRFSGELPDKHLLSANNCILRRLLAGGTSQKSKTISLPVLLFPFVSSFLVDIVS